MPSHSQPQWGLKNIFYKAVYPFVSAIHTSNAGWKLPQNYSCPANHISQPHPAAECRSVDSDAAHKHSSTTVHDSMYPFKPAAVQRLLQCFCCHCAKEWSWKWTSLASSQWGGSETITLAVPMVSPLDVDRGRVLSTPVKSEYFCGSDRVLYMTCEPEQWVLQNTDTSLLGRPHAQKRGFPSSISIISITDIGWCTVLSGACLCGMWVIDTVLGEGSWAWWSNLEEVLMDSCSLRLFTDFLCDPEPVKSPSLSAIILIGPIICQTFAKHTRTECSNCAQGAVCFYKEFHWLQSLTDYALL